MRTRRQADGGTRRGGGPQSAVDGQKAACWKTRVGLSLRGVPHPERSEAELRGRHDEAISQPGRGADDEERQLACPQPI